MMEARIGRRFIFRLRKVINRGFGLAALGFLICVDYLVGWLSSEEVESARVTATTLRTTREDKLEAG